MSGYRLHDPAAVLAGLVAPFLVALALVPLRTELSRRDPLPGRPLPPEEARLVSVALASQAGAALDTAGLSHQG
ncbi:hypothetical protein [Streptomyces sp. NPDC001568]|uniref:hypothetical protein n=1 Tax=Streptomyces sp. NPDC001568 TaxID=3364588 RepID=UPI0036AB66B8